MVFVTDRDQKDESGNTGSSTDETRIDGFVRGDVGYRSQSGSFLVCALCPAPFSLIHPIFLNAG